MSDTNDFSDDEKLKKCPYLRHINSDFEGIKSFVSIDSGSLEKSNKIEILTDSDSSDNSTKNLDTFFSSDDEEYLNHES